jgi:hypothetical protein
MHIPHNTIEENFPKLEPMFQKMTCTLVTFSGVTVMTIPAKQTLIPYLTQCEVNLNI